MDATNAKTVRFLENHDEPRAATALQPADRERAASVVLATLPGATLWHEGQLDGRRVRLPVFLARRPEEELSAERREYLMRLIAAGPDIRVLDGAWTLLATEGWPNNDSHEALLAWSWESSSARSLVVVNFSATPAQGVVRLGETWSSPPAGSPLWTFTDALTGTTYERDGSDLAEHGLFVDLPPWQHHVWTTAPTRNGVVRPA